MKVLIVNTYETKGGAAIAANRLMKALSIHKVEVSLVVAEKSSHNTQVIVFSPHWKVRLQFLLERFQIWLNNRFSKKNLFSIDFASHGLDITKLPTFKETDIIHFHWINQGMLSMKIIDKIIRSGKPIVWTMHDMWPFTGICHYNNGCNGFEKECGNCPYLVHPTPKDASHTVWKKKKAIYNNLTLVGCSQWIAEEAKKSSLAKEQTILSIPNPIDTTIFKPINKEEARSRTNLPHDKYLLLFGADRIDDERKGFHYLVAALQQLHKENPLLKDKVEIIMFGQVKNKMETDLPFVIHQTGYIKGDERLVDLYNAADLFIIPSLEDNLPNTIMEAMACGTPCVGFKIGGIPEMIDHQQNGYIAEPRNSEDLATGIRWMIDYPEQTLLSENAVNKVTSHYSEEIIAERYTELYQTLLSSCNQ